MISKPIEHLFESFIEHSLSVRSLSVDTSEAVVACNAAMAALLDLPPGDLCGRRLEELLTTESLRALHEHLGEDAPVLLNFVDRHNYPQTLSCHVAEDAAGLRVLGESHVTSEQRLTKDLLEINDELALLARENARKSRLIEKGRQRLEAALAELQTSYWHLEKIGEVLPICLECGRVKSRGPSWENVADYLRRNSLFLSHGYCPECRDLAAARASAPRKEDPSDEPV